MQTNLELLFSGDLGHAKLFARIHKDTAVNAGGDGKRAKLYIFDADDGWQPTSCREMMRRIKDTLEVVLQQEVEDQINSAKIRKKLQSIHIHPRSVLQLVYHSIRDKNFVVPVVV